jgi:hypothetical protein
MGGRRRVDDGLLVLVRPSYGLRKKNGTRFWTERLDCESVAVD